MNSIEIHIKRVGNNINILVDHINNQIIINNEKREINKEKLDELLRIIRTWESNYQNKNNQVDTETFLIQINGNEGTDIIQGEGAYPDNYIALKDWIREFYE